MLSERFLASTESRPLRHLRELRFLHDGEVAVETLPRLLQGMMRHKLRRPRQIQRHYRRVFKVRWNKMVCGNLVRPGKTIVRLSCLPSR